MPTPSDNAPIEAISTRVCPEADRIASWRDPESSEPIDLMSPENFTEPSVLSHPNNGTALPTKAEKLNPVVDDESDAIRATSPPESTCIRSQSPTVPQSRSSLLNWEFSNVRVSADSPGCFLSQPLLNLPLAFTQQYVLISSFRKQICRNTTK